MKKIAFFVSGNGTNMENLVKEIQAGRIQAEAALVVSDNPAAGALEKAADLKVKTAVVNRKDFESKSAFERGIIDILRQEKIDLVCLAGFMKILSADFVNEYYGKIINIHPAYLPQFPGAHAIQDAYDAKVSETGVTVHFVTPEVDAGPIILQRKVPVDTEEKIELLEERVHALEYELYPEALRKVLAGEVRMDK